MTTLRTTAARWAAAEIVTSPALRRGLAVVTFAAATAFGARVALPIPGTPVPFTLQPLFVLLAGALLGARLGAASQALYLAVGIAGLPVFAAGGGAAYLLGPTGGYLLAYPLAAWVAGALADRGAGARSLGLLAALATIHLGGAAWLGAAQGGVTAGLLLGSAPFFLADLAKAGMVLLAAGRLRGRARERLDG